MLSTARGASILLSADAMEMGTWASLGRYLIRCLLRGEASQMVRCEARGSLPSLSFFYPLASLELIGTHQHSSHSTKSVPGHRRNSQPLPFAAPAVGVKDAIGHAALIAPFLLHLYKDSISESDLYALEGSSSLAHPHLTQAIVMQRAKPY